MQRTIISAEEALIAEAGPEVREFLKANPGLDKLVARGLSLARSHFSGMNLELTHFMDPEDSIGGTLFIAVWTSLSPKEMKEEMYAFFRGKWREIYLAADGKLAVTVRFK